MTLQPQTLTVTFGKRDDKVDAHNAPPGTLTTARNVLVSKAGRIQKRPGFATLPKPTAMDTGKDVAMRGSEVLVRTNDSIWTSVTLGAEYVRKGAWSNVQPRITTLASNSSSASVPDVWWGNSSGEPIVYVWEDARSGGQIRYLAKDPYTGGLIVQDALVDGSGAGFQSPRIVHNAGGGFLILYLSSATTLKARTLTFTNSVPTLSTAATVSAALNTARFDVAITKQTAGGLAVITYQTAGGLQVVSWNMSLNVATTGPNMIGVVGTESLGWLDRDESSTDVYLARGGTADSRVEVYTIAIATMLASATDLVTAGIAFERVSQITGYVDLVSFPSIKHVYYQVPGTYNGVTGTLAAKMNDQVRHGQYQAAGSVSVVLRCAGILSRAWLPLGSTAYHMAVAYEGTRGAFDVGNTDLANIQQTGFILRLSDGELVTRFLSQLSGGHRERSSTLSNASMPGGNYPEAFIAVTQKVQSVIDPATGPTIVKAISELRVDYADFNKRLGMTPEAAGSAYISGGFVRQYDGANVTELGFHVYPEMPRIPPAAALNTRQHILVYAWFDGNGNLHRSAPSEPTLTGTGSNSLLLPTLRLTNKTGVFIEVYGSDDGLNYYKVSPTVGPPQNDTTVDEVAFTDVVSAPTLSRGELLYTTGGVFPHDPPPAAAVLSVHKDRLWLAGQDLAGHVWPSAPIVPDSGISFSGQFEIDLDTRFGEVTALGTLDDKVVTFCERALLWLTGDGPDVLGRGDFSSFNQVPGADTCILPRTVVSMPAGLMYASPNRGGIYLLDRGLGVSYIGSDIEIFNGQQCTGALYSSDKNLVYFATASAGLLVYNEFFKHWYIWTEGSSDGQTVTLSSVGITQDKTGNVYILDANGTVSATSAFSPTQDNDISARYFVSSFTTAWIQPFGLNGYGRLWRVQVLGTTGDIDSTQLQLKLYYDHKDFTVVEDVLGVPDPAPDGYQIQLRPKQQRFSALKVYVDDFDGNSLDGLDVSAIVLQVGAQPGSLSRQPNNLFTPV